MAESNLEILAEIVRAGGNLAAGYEYDGSTDEVRKIDQKRLDAVEAEIDREASAAKARAKIAEAAKLPVNSPSSNIPNVP